jgi:hypothetical protein
LFGFLEKNGAAAALFDGSMTGMTSRQAAAVVARYDFSAARKLVDVGGGHGGLATAILRANPCISAILYDRPAVLARAVAHLAELGVLHRVELIGGDFFASVPSGADLYLLKDILHDWDDARARTILANVRRAMPKGARLLVVERIVPVESGPSPSKLVDISMLVLTGGRERTDDEYRALLTSAELATRRVVAVDGETSIIEAEAA